MKSLLLLLLLLLNFNVVLGILLCNKTKYFIQIIDTENVIHELEADAILEINYDSIVNLYIMYKNNLYSVIKRGVLREIIYTPIGRCSGLIYYNELLETNCNEWATLSFREIVDNIENDDSLINRLAIINNETSESIVIFKYKKSKNYL